MSGYEEELSTMAQRGVDTAKELQSTAYEKATRAVQASQGFVNQACQQSRQIGDQACSTTKHYWNNVPLFRWATYALGALLAIPLALFIGWIVIVSTIALLPAAGFFTFLAIIVAFIAFLAWGGLRGANVILSKLGVTNKKNLSEYSKSR